MRFRTACAVVALLGGGIGRPTFAQPPAGPAKARPDREVLHALADLRRQYGSDAVMIEGFLMGHAIESGSVLETSVSVSGFEEHQAHRYLGFKLDTGIVYNDRDVPPALRPGRTWTRIVERTLRRFRSITVPADGLVFLVTYTHRPYDQGGDWRAELSHDHGVSESVAYYLLNADLADFLAARIDAQQLLDRGSVLVNGAPEHIVPEPPAPTPAPTAP